MIKECSTKYFGNYSYDEESIILFQSLKDTNLAFFTVNPFAFSEDYHPIPTDKELKSIGAKDMSDVAVYVICSMTDDISTSTANLKCPIIVNTHNNKALQVILDNPEYQFRHSFSEEAKS